MKEIIRMEKVEKVYNTGAVRVHALRGIDLTIMEREFVAIMGPSGSGKSTLMNIIGCLDKPTSGNYFFEGVDVKELNRDELADIRNQKIGFVFQSYNLLPRTSAVENVELPLVYNRRKKIKNTRQLAIKALERVGLAHRIHHEPSQLSGGEQQRVAIARALVNEPSVILADEPTGNLDTRSSIDIMALFQQLNDQGITIVLVTHDPEIVVYAKRVIRLKDGRIVDDYPVKERRKAREDLAALPEREEEE